MLSRDEVARLLAQPRGSAPLALRDRALLELMYACGLRASEAVGLDLGDVDLEEGLLRARGKGSKERIVPVGRQALAALFGYCAAGGRELVGEHVQTRLFVNHRGGELTRQGLYKIVQGHARRAGLEDKMSPHTLRHTFATHLLGRRLRPALAAGDARPRRPRDDAGLHAPVGRPAEGRLLRGPPARPSSVSRPRRRPAAGGELWPGRAECAAGELDRARHRG